MADFGIGGPQFGLRDVKIAAWNSTGSYGTLYDVPSVSSFSFNINTVNAQLEGDDIITDTHAVAVSSQVTMRFGSVSFPVYAVLTGATTVTYNSGASDELQVQQISDLSFPFFGVLGKALSTDGSGAFHIFIPKVKIMEGFQVTMEYGNYVIPEVSGMAVKDGGWGIYTPLQYATDIAIATMPPTLA